MHSKFQFERSHPRKKLAIGDIPVRLDVLPSLLVSLPHPLLLGLPPLLYPFDPRVHRYHNQVDHVPADGGGDAPGQLLSSPLPPSLLLWTSSSLAGSFLSNFS